MSTRLLLLKPCQPAQRKEVLLLPFRGRKQFIFYIVRYGLMAAATLFIYFRLFHTFIITFIQYSHSYPFAEASSFSSVLVSLRGKNLPGVPSRDLNSGLPADLRSFSCNFFFWAGICGSILFAIFIYIWSIFN